MVGKTCHVISSIPSHIMDVGVHRFLGTIAYLCLLHVTSATDVERIDLADVLRSM
jgi:hypothetical protein